MEAYIVRNELFSQFATPGKISIGNSWEHPGGILFHGVGRQVFHEFSMNERKRKRKTTKGKRQGKEKDDRV